MQRLREDGSQPLNLRKNIKLKAERRLSESGRGGKEFISVGE